jgi:DNA-binding transcriptional ArsR family regulator
MDSGGAKITLDQESFKALASDVRVGILKRLDVRRETVTDLSNLMTLSKPTLLEHLEKLQSAGLVKRVDEGRKWIYYELSGKGRKILHPERVAITLALGIAVALAAIGAFLVLSAEVAVVPGSPRMIQAVPSAGQSVLSGPIGFAALAFGLAIASGVVALALRFIGQRRRERFFEQLGAA